MESRPTQLAASGESGDNLPGMDMVTTATTTTKSYPLAVSGKRVSQLPMVQQKKKWSDWSECSASCVKTRHRANCDDIIGSSNQTIAWPTNDKIKPGSHAGAAQLISAQRLAGEEEEEEEQEGGAKIRRDSKVAKITKRTEGVKKDQIQDNDEDDLEGPEEASLESRRTDKTADSQIIKGSSSEDENDYADEGDEEDESDSCVNVDPSKTIEQRPCTGGQCRLGLAMSEGKLNHRVIAGRHPSKQKVASLHPDEQPAAAGPLRGWPGARPAQPAKQFPAPDTHQAPTGRAQVHNLNHARPAGHQPAASAPVLPADQPASLTNGTWPRLLLLGAGQAPELALQGGLIQWTILIGSLLSIILLVAFLVRKLVLATVPSYHWMLAKQALKSSTAGPEQLSAAFSSRSSSAPGERWCPQHGLHTFACSLGCLEGAPGERVAPPHHMRFVWARTQAPSLLEPGGLCRGQPASPHQQQQQLARQLHAQLQHVVEADGRHLLATRSGAKFNTDGPLAFGSRRQIDASSPAYMEPAPLTLGSASSARAHRLSSDAPELSAPALGVRSVRSLSECNGYDTPGYGTRSVGGGGGGAGSPGGSCTGTGAGAGAATAEGGAPAESRATSLTSSDSLQSTTAQMLSNAASSSFEQPAEFGAHEQPAGPTEAPPMARSADGSPAVGRLRNSAPKNSSSCLHHQWAAEMAQSQPNSPMFVNVHTPSTLSSTNKASARRARRAPRLAPSNKVRSSQPLDLEPRADCHAGARHPPPAGHRRQPSLGRDDGRHFYEEIDQLRHS